MLPNSLSSPHVYATDERVAYGARVLRATTQGPSDRRAFARAAAAPYYSRSFVHKVNDTIPHRYVFASVGNDKTAKGPHTIEIGDLLFAYNPDQTPNHGRDIPDVLKLTTLTQRNDPNTVYAASWQYLEEWLGTHPNRYNDGHEIAREWQLLGMAHNDVLPGGFAHPALKDAPTRALNVVVGGRAAVSNIWGATIAPCSRLYLKVEKDKENSRWHLTPVSASKLPACNEGECLIHVGRAIESTSSDPFYNSLVRTEQRAEYVRKRPLTHRVVVYLGI